METLASKRFWLCPTALFFGAFTMLAQILLLRSLLASLEENEILLTLFYALWFMGIFLGAWVGGREKGWGEPPARMTLRTIH